MDESIEPGGIPRVSYYKLKLHDIKSWSFAQNISHHKDIKNKASFLNKSVMEVVKRTQYPLPLIIPTFSSGVKSFFGADTFLFLI